VCALCRAPGRDDALLCVVESPADLYAVEQATGYRGRYFVLHGRLSPLDGRGPKELGLDQLADRLAEGDVRELIVATNPMRCVCRASSATLHRESGTFDRLGDSQASALTCTTTSGGKRPGASRPWPLFQAGQPFIEEAFAPHANHFPTCIQPSADLIITQPLSRQKHHSGAQYKKIR